MAEANSSDDNSVATSVPNPATSFTFDRTWLATRKAVAAADGRPFVIEEFGALFILPQLTVPDSSTATVKKADSELHSCGAITHCAERKHSLQSCGLRSAASLTRLASRHAGKFVPRPVTDNDPEIQTIRDPWFTEVFSQTNNSIFADEPLRGEPLDPGSVRGMCSL